MAYGLFGLFDKNMKCRKYIRKISSLSINRHVLKCILHQRSVIETHNLSGNDAVKCRLCIMKGISYERLIA